MRQINIHDAKTQLSRLIAAVEKGEEILIARNGQPVARLVPVQPARVPRQPGSARGKVKIPASFFQPLPDDILEAFES